MWFRLDSNNALHTFLNRDSLYNHKLALACGLVTIPSRRTFDRRLKTISIDIKERITTMGYLFVAERLAMVDDHFITAVDSTLIKAKGRVWHKSSIWRKEKYLALVLIQMQDGAIAVQRDGYLDINYIYNIYNRKDCGTSNSRDVTTANVPDNKMYVPLTLSSLVFSLPSVLYMIADLGYDAKKLYEYSKKTLGIDLVCPVKRYKSTSKKRLELVCFFESVLGHSIYNQRGISVEPLIEST